MLDSRPVTLSVSDIHKSFGPSDVLKGITIQAQQGDVISILGASGSGKVRCCAALTCWKRPMPEWSASAGRRLK